MSATAADKDPAFTTRRCTHAEISLIHDVINRAARAYKGVIPDDRWHEPYMPLDELRGEIRAGVSFHGAFTGGTLVGVMGVQPVRDVTLIRHAYVDPPWQGCGVGSALLEALLARTRGRVLVGTWRAAGWAVGFYEKHGFRRADGDRSRELLQEYWEIPERQVEESVVLQLARDA